LTRKQSLHSVQWAPLAILELYATEEGEKAKAQYVRDTYGQSAAYLSYRQAGIDTNEVLLVLGLSRLAFV
jgi:hypothetical protein